MEKETSLLHLLSEHQFIIFIVAALILMSLFFVIGFLIGKRMERARKAEQRRKVKEEPRGT
jgi:phosphotransferase system  glucose/maltose/N-acetylglucosamine-specific IIC component